MRKTLTNVHDTNGLTLDEAAIVEIERGMPRAQGVAELTRSWDDAIVYYDFGPGRHTDKAAAVAEISGQFGNVVNVRTQILELTLDVAGDMAYAISRQNFISDRPGGGETLSFVFRKSDVYVRYDGTWRIVHQHLSVPTDPTSGVVLLISEVDPATE